MINSGAAVLVEQFTASQRHMPCPQRMIPTDHRLGLYHPHEYVSPHRTMIHAMMSARALISGDSDFGTGHFVQGLERNAPGRGLDGWWVKVLVVVGHAVGV